MLRDRPAALPARHALAHATPCARHPVARPGLAAAVLLASLLAPAAARGEPGPPAPSPIPWQEPGPAGRLFLQQPLDRPEPLAPGATGVDVRVLYANTLVVADGARARVDVDLESALATVAVRAGVAGDVELALALPVFSDAGGVFDGFIEGVERAFDSQNYQRDGRARGLARYRLGPAGGGGLSRDGGATALGDAWAAAKWLAMPGGGLAPAVALRGAVKAPTGGPTFGSGTWDLGAGLLVAWRWPGGALRLAVDGALPTGRLARADLETRPYGTAQAGLVMGLTGWLAAHLQLSAHLSPLDRTGVPQLDKPIYDAAFGLSAALSPRAEVVLAGVENFASPRRGADAALILALRFTAPGGPGDEATRQQPEAGGRGSGSGPASASASLAAAPSRGR